MALTAYLDALKATVSRDTSRTTSLEDFDAGTFSGNFKQNAVDPYSAMQGEGEHITGSILYQRADWSPTVNDHVTRDSDSTTWTVTAINEVDSLRAIAQLYRDNRRTAGSE
jgi:hypothetical protein